MNTEISQLVPERVFWNMRAREQNTKVFIRTFHRNPKDYEEVRAWLDSMCGVKKCW